MWSFSCVVLFLLMTEGMAVDVEVEMTVKMPAVFKTMTAQRLTALRVLMASQPSALAAYIIPTADAHNSEYIAPVDARREWITGFTGSAGTAVVTDNVALVWTDGRYYTQFEQEVDTDLWTLMKQSLPDTPSMEKWLTSHLKEGSIVGVDSSTFTRDEWTPLQTALMKASMQLIPVVSNLVDQARYKMDDPPPKRANDVIIPLPLKYTGKSAGSKIAELRQKMAEKKASALILTALDDVAYTLNLRGSDIEYNPVFFAYLVITPTTIQFFHNGVLPANVITHLKDEDVGEVTSVPYDDIFEQLKGLAVDVLKTPLNLISEISPVQLMKLIKNEVELYGFRQCHIRDGIAVCRLLRWLHLQIDAGVTVTENDVSDQLLRFRRDEADFMGLSFATIAASGPNAAIIHYHPSRNGTQKVIEKTEMFLLDSGGQYKDGTTDITRTRFMGKKPSDEQIATFTRVLKGQIMMGSTLFPQGVKGNVLDSFARHSLWQVGLDYAHGTGHGVGHFLNVHEGPTGISWRPYHHDPGLKPGQILSNEPGYYKVGEYGIRHEDLVETIAITKDSAHLKARDLMGNYDDRGVLGFNTITMVPHQKECIDANMLTDFELSYINAYHKRVLETLGPIMESRGLTDDLKWLENECAPIAVCACP